MAGPAWGEELTFEQRLELLLPERISAAREYSWNIPGHED
jgi:hypothetical protein